MTYPHSSVNNFIAEHLVPLRLLLNRADDRAHFRAYQVIWTPTLVLLDRRGAAHYRSLGYLPPDLFLNMLHIGLARVHLAWARYDQAAALLGVVADEPSGALAPEALYWLGIAWYLQARRRGPLMRAWRRLLEEHPQSIWAARVPPNQDDGSEP